MFMRFQGPSIREVRSSIFSLEITTVFVSCRVMAVENPKRESLNTPNSMFANLNIEYLLALAWFTNEFHDLSPRESVSACPTIQSAYLDLVIATFRRCHSRKNPMLPSPKSTSLLLVGPRTHERITISFSRPYN